MKQKALDLSKNSMASILSLILFTNFKEPQPILFIQSGSPGPDLSSLLPISGPGLVFTGTMINSAWGQKKTKKLFIDNKINIYVVCKNKNYSKR